MKIINWKSENELTRVCNCYHGYKVTLWYKKDAVILQKNIETWPLSINILKGLPFVTEVKIVSISKHGGRVIVKFLGNKKTFFHATYEKGLFFKNLSNHQYILSKWI